ncbi:uncharacterized protein FTOL_02701 [Fusarium torulosum]|uniref:BTB domain-containing protein n=1 Tax=Fusarium torulosum TaxID=33205 RepID=A0AAE8M2P6_9HYPO|nr:uncharacterized protein FTOL_02701 [Fusarium torulosum]
MMDAEKDTRATESPYASEICAVYFQGKGPFNELFLATVENGPFSSTLGDVHLEDITFDTGHVIIHYLFTNTYQCLKPRVEVPEKKNALEFVTALRVYIATERLSLHQLRELAREELVRLGDKLELSTLIKVMEESISSFEVLPGITAYIESRLLSFSEESSRATADRVLTEMGIPDTLSKVLFRSIVLMKASERSLAAEPTIQHVAVGRSGITLLPKVEAIKLAEAKAEDKAAQEALRIAEEIAVAEEMAEIRELRCKRATRGKLTSRQKRRLHELLDNAAKRDEYKAARKTKDNEAKLAENKPTGEVESSISSRGNEEQTLTQSDDGKDTGSELLSTRKTTGNAQGSSNTAQTSGDRFFGRPFDQSDDETEQSSDVVYPLTPSFSQASSSW